MYQAVSRRFQHYLDGDEKFSPLPDLLLIDGGDVHTATAERAMEDLGLQVPCFGMVKDDRHRTRALMTADGREIGISGNQAVFSLIGNIQEETHNSAISYQRQLRKEGFASELDRVESIGPKRKNDLLRHFRSLKAIREASLEELREIVPQNAAEAVYRHFHEEETDGCESSAASSAEES